MTPDSALDPLTATARASVPSDPPGWRLFTGLFEEAARAGLPLVPLRPRSHDQITALSGGDYDLLMPMEGFPQLVAVLWRCALHVQASFSINRVNPHKIQVYLHVPEAGKNILLEIWTRLDVRDPARRSARAIPWTALAGHLIHCDGRWRLRPEVEAALYLSHLATRGKSASTPLVATRLAWYGGLVRSHAPDLLPFFESQTQLGFTAAAAVHANLWLRQQGILRARGPLGVMVDRLRAKGAQIGRRWRRRRLRQTRIMAVTGADGVGKSSMIAQCIGASAGDLRPQRFKNLFRHHPLYQCFYAVRAPVVRRRRGGKLNRNAFDELHARVLFACARASWPWLRVLAALYRRCCLDRCFHDLLFVGLRGTGAPPGLDRQWRERGARMPLPDWHVHLDAPDAVIHSRKRELTAVSLQAYREGMIAIVGTFPALGFSRIDTCGPPDHVLACVRLAARSLGLRLRWQVQAT